MAVDDLAGGVGALRKHVSATGRVSWVLTVANVEITMSTKELMSAERAQRKIFEALLKMDVYSLPPEMTATEWRAMVNAQLVHAATPCGRARTIDGAWRRQWWRRPLLTCRRLLRAA